MPVAIVIGGKSELLYVTAILDEGHAWAALSTCGANVVSADGDSKIPEVIDNAIAQGHRTVVMLDNDAVARAHEQASVIGRSDVRVYTLSSDFEGAFDAEIVQLALTILKCEAGVTCLADALKFSVPFDGILNCARPANGAHPFGKAQLAQALGEVSRRYWYVPRELDAVFEAVGEECGLKRTLPPQLFSWSPDATHIESFGRLYVSNHISNDRVVYWDFQRRGEVEVALPKRFDGTIAICRRGTRIIAREFVRDSQHVLPTNTWVHIFDLQGELLTQRSRFRVPGSAFELCAEEDGNHLRLCIQRDEASRYGLRCLIDGTQQEKLELPTGAIMYGPKVSPSARFTASGPQPVKISTSSYSHVVFPHFYAHSYVWSPCERYLAFFGRRWGKPPDWLWLYDLQEDRVHRLAGGDHFIPVYWM
jgi:hypothetical protein